MRIYKLLILSVIVICCACNEKISKDSTLTTVEKEVSTTILNKAPKKIPVLNFGTFHMGNTVDENKTEFDEHDKENQRKVHEIVKKIASFKPTVILVETPPTYNPKLQSEYNEYLKNPDMFFKRPSEIELLAYELGRLCGTKRIYGIDHKMSYNYKVGREVDNKVDATLHDTYYKNPFKYYPEFNPKVKDMSLFDNLKQTNKSDYLDFMITVNADMLTHVGTEKGFEGADEAAKYYQRNLRMYSNLNRINLGENDRVFILMGASHTAFFRDFISRSPKYKMVDTFEYLK